MLYFAWVREGIGVGRGDASTRPRRSRRVAALIDWLATAQRRACGGVRRSVAAARGGRSGVRAARRADRRRARGGDLPAGDGRMIRDRRRTRADRPRGRAWRGSRRGRGRWRPSPGWSAPTTASTTLELEHYPGATEAALRRLCARRRSTRWSLRARDDRPPRRADAAGRADRLRRRRRRRIAPRRWRRARSDRPAEDRRAVLETRDARGDGRRAGSKPRAEPTTAAARPRWRRGSRCVSRSFGTQHAVDDVHDAVRLAHVGTSM